MKCERERLEDIKKAEEHLISFRVLKVINIRFPQSQVSIVNPVNRREVAYVVSYFTVLKQGWFSLARVLFSAESRNFQRRKCKIHQKSSGVLIRVLDGGKGKSKKDRVNVGVDSVKRATASFSQLDDGNILLSGTILCVVQRNRRRLQEVEKWSKKKHDQ